MGPLSTPLSTRGGRARPHAWGHCGESSRQEASSLPGGKGASDEAVRCLPPPLPAVPGPPRRGALHQVRGEAFEGPAGLIGADGFRGEIIAGSGDGCRCCRNRGTETASLRGAVPPAAATSDAAALELASFAGAGSPAATTSVGGAGTAASFTSCTAALAGRSVAAGLVPTRKTTALRGRRLLAALSEAAGGGLLHDCAVCGREVAAAQRRVFCKTWIMYA